MKIAAAVILASSFGCEATPNIRSYRACNFTTTPAGYVVSVPEGYDVATVHGWVDSQVERWISDKVTWGCTATADHRLSRDLRSRGRQRRYQWVVYVRRPH